MDRQVETLRTTGRHLCGGVGGNAREKVDRQLQLLEEPHTSTVGRELRPLH